MKLVVGLGNPTEAYTDTRHNLGFRVVDLLAERWGCGFRPSKFKADVADARVAQHKVSLVKPQTYMNCSGEAVGPMARTAGIVLLVEILLVIFIRRRHAAATREAPAQGAVTQGSTS